MEPDDPARSECAARSECKERDNLASPEEIDVERLVWDLEYRDQVKHLLAPSDTSARTP